MNHFLKGMVRAVAETFPLPGPLLEVGSLQVEGQEELVDLRELFPDREYLGIDLREGPGVDVVGSLEKLPLYNHSAGSVLMLNTLEHVRKFWKGLDEVQRVLRPDGALLISCPFYFHLHDYPSDYWRFSPAALEVLLEDYPHKIIGWQGNEKRPMHVWALAFHDEAEPITPVSFERFLNALRKYAHEPMPRGRRLWLRILQCLAGERFFAPFLELNRWHATWIGPTTTCRASNLAPSTSAPTQKAETARSTSRSA